MQAAGGLLILFGILALWAVLAGEVHFGKYRIPVKNSRSFKLMAPLLAVSALAAGVWLILPHQSSLTSGDTAGAGVQPSTPPTDNQTGGTVPSPTDEPTPTDSAQAEAISCPPTGGMFLSPEQAGPAQAITVVGCGFDTRAQISIYLTGFQDPLKNTIANAAGAFKEQILIPDSADVYCGQTLPVTAQAKPGIQHPTGYSLQALLDLQC